MEDNGKGDCFGKQAQSRDKGINKEGEKLNRNEIIAAILIFLVGILIGHYTTFNNNSITEKELDDIVNNDLDLVWDSDRGKYWLNYGINMA